MQSVMKSGQFMSYFKRKKIVKKIYKNCDQKTSSRPFCVCKELRTASVGKGIFWNKLLILVCISKAIKICSNQHTDLLKIKKGLELVSQVIFFIKLFDKIFSVVILHKLVGFYYQTVYFPIYSVKCISCFMLGIWWRH